MRDIQEILGENIKHHRKIKNIQQGALSELTGIGQANLSRIENGKIDTGLSSIQKIAEGLDISIPELLTDTSNPESTIIEKVLQIESLNEYDKKLLGALIESFLEKNRLAGIQDLKMKTRLEELERARGK